MSSLKKYCYDLEIALSSKTTKGREEEYQWENMFIIWVNDRINKSLINK